MKSRSKLMLEKSIGAMIAAIEVYNKPMFEYREETFSILAINSWELLLKSRILQLENNRISSILEYERRTRNDGILSDKFYRKLNRSNNQISIGLFKALDRLNDDYSDKIPKLIKVNLEALVEIRDNSIHFMNKDLFLRKKIHEIGSACLKNYFNIIRRWFGRDLSNIQLFLMPISFIRNFANSEGIILNGEAQKLLAYIKNIENENEDNIINDFNFSLKIEISLKKGKEDSDSTFKLSDSPEAIQVKLEEEDIREKYPLTYEILTNKLRRRYSNFKANHIYHKLRKEFEANENFCNHRALDPGNPNSISKKFYNGNIIKEFDKHYTRK